MTTVASSPAHPLSHHAAPAAPSSPPSTTAGTYVAPHPSLQYTTTVPVDATILTAFPNPFSKEDITAAPPLLYAHARPVEQCVSTHFTKYPHPSVPEILDCPVTVDRTDATTGIRYRTRIIRAKNIAPWIFRKFVGASDVITCEERSEWNPTTRELTLYSHNQTFSSFISAREASRFRPHPDNPQWTSFVQYGGIRCPSYMGPLRRPLESFVSNRMIRGGLEASQFVDQVLMSQSPFE